MNLINILHAQSSQKKVKLKEEAQFGHLYLIFFNKGKEV